MKNRFASLAVIVASLVGVSQLSAQKSSPEQCSLAVLSHVVSNKQPVCSSKAVQQMALSGHVFEQNQLGMASMLVIGPEYSENEALKWFERAAQRGYAPAQVNLAAMYLNGWGTPMNYALALHWLHAAADQGFPRAYYNLGVIFLNGQGVHQDYAQAFRWFQKGAEANDSDAQTNLGYLYDQGLGCQHSAGKAVLWYRKAADAGNALGENNLADMYLRGEGVPQNNDEAFRLFQKAAIQGSTGARIKLGYMYANGLGVKKDPQAAYAWISAASMAGDRRGDYLIPALKELLTAQQISTASQKSYSAPFKPNRQLPINKFVP
jgi:uncharacterized protein